MAGAERSAELIAAIGNGQNGQGLRVEALGIIFKQVANGGPPDQGLVEALERGWRKEGGVGEGGRLDIEVLQGKLRSST